MKQALCLFFVTVFFSLTAFSQGIRLNAYSAYVFNDKVDSYFDNTNYYNGQINGGFQWGLGLELMAHKFYGVELSYLRQNTTAPITYFSNGIKLTNFDLGVNYILLGGNRYLPLPGKLIEPYGGAQIGMAIMNLENPTTNVQSNKTKLAWGLKGGMNIWASKMVGIKLQAQLLSAVQSVGGGFYFGTGGTGAGLSTYSSIYQFSVGGGLVFRLGR